MIKQPFSLKAGFFRTELSAWVVLVLSTLVTFASWMFSNQYIERRAQEHFAHDTQEAHQKILYRMGLYEQALRGGVAFLNTQNTPSRQAWKQYVADLRLQKTFPGLQGFGYAKIVTESQLPKFEQGVQSEGFSGFEVNPPGKRALYAPILFLEPFDERNRRAFGYDMYSEPVRREAIDLAIDRGDTVISGTVKLVQETESDVQPGFLMYLPVYDPQKSILTITQRRAAVRGVLYSPFRVRDLMQGVLGDYNVPLTFEIYDSSSPDPARLLYSSLNAGEKSGVREYVDELPLKGRQWTVVFRSTPAFEESFNRTESNAILVAGFVIDLLLFLIIWNMANQRKKLAAVNQSLALAQARRSGLMDALKGQYAFYSCDADGVLRYASPSLPRLLQLPALSEGENLVQLLNSSHPASDVSEALARSIQNRHNSAFTQEFQCVTDDGGLIITGSNCVVLDDQHQLMSIEGVVQDVSPRRRNEMELERYRDGLEELVAERTRRLEEAQERLKISDRRMMALIELAKMPQEASLQDVLSQAFADLVRLFLVKKLFLVELTNACEHHKVWTYMPGSDYTRCEVLPIEAENGAMSLIQNAAKDQITLRRNTPQFNVLGTEYPVFSECQNLLICPSSEAFGKVYVLGLADAESRFSNSDELQCRLYMEDLVRILLKAESVQALRNSNDKALNANQAKSLFLANMSHEIRTPLNSIIGLNALLIDEVRDPDQLQKLSRIQDASEHLLAVLDDVLCFAKIESGTVEIHDDDFSATQVAGQVIDSFRAQAERKRMSIRMEADALIPAQVQGDSLRYRQVLSNLLSNALKFSDQGEVLVRLCVPERDDTQCTLQTEVIDQGPGIEQQQVNHLLQPFEQTDLGPARAPGSVGLGLPIANRLTGLMGGELTIEQAAGRGTAVSFTVKLRCKSSPALAIDNRSAIERAVGYSKDLKSRHVLVVEDNAFNQKVIESILMRLGMRITVVENGLKALETIQSDESIDLVLMDLHMPVMTGVEATRRIRMLPGPTSKLPVVALTACASIEEEEACRLAGMNDFLTKPVEIVKIAKTLSRLLKRQGQTV
ncbi:CHASE domain-containing protein [Limnobacter litoralis]|uniref:histidine kinase n=1 Tax=Limnobacter litoralis TaxID=481366 RepID=A0ABQ5YR87_9BURK|nr:CHASE domain-containing protein [Limnobacter litoralis]GLR25369.1 hypothetical protein GCM10007875_04570 [Limnobacter litoralis]